MSADRRRRTSHRVVTAVLALGVAACGVRTQSEPEPVPRERLPRVETGTSSPAPASLERVWGARDGKLVPVFVDLPSGGVTSRINALLELVAPEQQPPTSLPADVRLTRIERQGERVLLTFTGELLQVSPREVPVVLGQLVLTATEEPGVVAVSVRSGDRRVQLVTPDGTTLSRPLRRADFMTFLD